MTPLVRSLLAASVLSALAGASAALALTRTFIEAEVRDPGDLPGFEERFLNDFDLPTSKRPLVRTILREYRERRREIEGRTAAAARTELTWAGRQVDEKLRGILPPPQRERYDQWSEKARPGAAAR